MIWEAMSELSAKLRESVYLRYYGGLTYAEIGGVLKIPCKTAESRVRLGHKALKKILMNEIEETSRK
jgi:DNA-directed RNA polymerase specialized sigma24 family protein